MGDQFNEIARGLKLECDEIAGNHLTALIKLVHPEIHAYLCSHGVAQKMPKMFFRTLG